MKSEDDSLMCLDSIDVGWNSVTSVAEYLSGISQGTGGYVHFVEANP